MKLMHSGAFSHLMQGMLKNYTDFLTELSHGSMALISQGQAEMSRQVQQTTSGVIDVAEAQGRRARQAA